MRSSKNIGRELPGEEVSGSPVTLVRGRLLFRKKKHIAPRLGSGLHLKAPTPLSQLKYIQSP